MTDKPGKQDSTAAKLQRERRELRRLETLIDVVFAMVIVMIAVDSPIPDSVDDLGSYFVSRASDVFVSALGVVVLLIYWFQNNLLLGNLIHTDGKHAGLSIFQVFLVLVYLKAVAFSIDVETGPLVMAVKSAAAALVGFAAAGAWWYACKDRRLLSDEITDEEAVALRIRVLAEPLTAMLTLVAAFIGPWVWELSWFTYPIFAAALRRAGIAEAKAIKQR